MRRRFALMLAALMLLTGIHAAAEFPMGGNEIPTEPIVTENDQVCVTAVYDEAEDLTRYTIELKDAAQFPDGTAVSAQDLLFTYYVCLDPGYAGEERLNEAGIAGLAAYRYQLEDVDAVLGSMEKIREAGAEHVWSESDAWSESLQEAYWSLNQAYEEACEAEYVVCAGKIVEACRQRLESDGAEAFGRPAEEVAQSDGLLTAYAMVQWGYAVCEDGVTLDGKRTGKSWSLDGGELPGLADFVEELKCVYGNDLGACWAVETTGTYEPALPDVRAGFLAAAAGELAGRVTQCAGIRLVDDRTLEVALEGIDMRSEAYLLGLPVLSRNAYGDAAQWAPEDGQYGHAFGDVFAVEAAVAADGAANSVQMLPDPPANPDFF